MSATLWFTGGPFAPPPGLIAHQTILGGWFGDAGPVAPEAVGASEPEVIAAPSPQIAECRSLAMALQRRQADLRGWDRTLVREITRWRRPPSAWEADQVAALAERLHWQGRDGATPC